MFPASTDTKEDGLKSLTESYHKYKREYVKHLGFNPEEENLSKHSLLSDNAIYNANCATMPKVCPFPLMSHISSSWPQNV